MICTPDATRCYQNSPERCSTLGMKWSKLDTCEGSEYCGEQTKTCVLTSGETTIGSSNEYADVLPLPTRPTCSHSRESRSSMVSLVYRVPGYSSASAIALYVLRVCRERVRQLLARRAGRDHQYGGVCILVVRSHVQQSHLGSRQAVPGGGAQRRDERLPVLPLRLRGLSHSFPGGTARGAFGGQLAHASNGSSLRRLRKHQRLPHALEHLQTMKAGTERVFANSGTHSPSSSSRRRS